MMDPSFVQQSWELFRLNVIDEDPERPASPEALDATYRVFLAGYAAALTAFAVLDRPLYRGVRQLMLDAAKRECDAVLKGQTDG